LTRATGYYCKVNVIKPYTEKQKQDGKRTLWYNYWTIYSLRTEVNHKRRVRGKMFPECCDNSNHFDYRPLPIALKQQLDQYWPDLSFPEYMRDNFTQKGLWSAEVRIVFNFLFF